MVAKPRRGGTRITIATVGPWWLYLFLISLLAFVVAVLVYDASKSNERERLRHGLWVVLASAYPAGAGAPLAAPGAAMPGIASASPAAAPRVACPFCKAEVAPFLDAQGRKLCPVCRNTGKAPTAVAR